LFGWLVGWFVVWLVGWLLVCNIRIVQLCDVTEHRNAG